MKPARLLILASSATFAVVGIAYFVVPGSALEIVGIPSSPTSDFLLRTEGVALLTGAALLWAASDGSSTQMRIALSAMAGYLIVGSIVDLAGFAQGVVGPTSVPSAVIRIVLGLACLVTALKIARRRGSSRGRTDRWLRGSTGCTSAVVPDYDHLARTRSHMPLFMDRHDVPGITPEQVAQAHQADVGAAARFGVAFLAYWFDADQGEAFCLAKAPAAESLTAVHKETHGLIPNEIIAVSEDNVLQFLGRMNEAGDDGERTNPFRTILFTDLEGSTSILQEVGQAEFMVLLTEHDLIIRRALVAARGREVKHTGDGIMASFDDVTCALECSLAIQAGFDTRAAQGQKPELRVRIGLAAGEPVDHNGDLFGSTVTLASRICNAANAGRILASDLVQSLGIESGFAFDGGRELMLKGFVSAIRVFELSRKETRSGAARAI